MALELFLGDDRIPVISWINRYGDLNGRKLRFVVGLDVKAKLEANRDATFTLRRGDEEFDIELENIEEHMTGTNGVKIRGEVRARPQAAVPDRPVEEASPTESPEAPTSEAPKKKPLPGKFKIPDPSEVSEVSEAASERSQADSAESAS